MASQADKIQSLSVVKLKLNDATKKLEYAVVGTTRLESIDVMGTLLHIDTYCTGRAKRILDSTLNTETDPDGLKQHIFCAILFYENNHCNEDDWLMDEDPHEWDDACLELLNRLFV